MPPVTLTAAPQWGAHRLRQSARIPHKTRTSFLRRSSGRGWARIEATDEQIAAALGIDRSNVARRRSGASGPYASTCEEVYRMEAAGISTYALTAHLKSVAMQVQLQNVPTEELMERLEALQEKETEIQSALDCKQVRWIVSRDVSLSEFRDRAAAQAAVSEEMVAILDEIAARQQP